MSDLKREDVARVLAEMHSADVGRGITREQVTLRRNLMRLTALRLDIRPEFDAALAEMEKEDRRG